MDFSQFVSDLLATLIGAGVAIWSAIWIDHRSRRLSDESHFSQKKKRAQSVLTLLLRELTLDSEALKTIDDNIPSTYRPLSTESWRAFAQGGELESIDDPKLLHSIAQAYSYIDQFLFLYERFFDMSFFPSKNAYADLKPVLHNHTFKAKYDCVQAVAQAIGDISRAIPESERGAVA